MTSSDECLTPRANRTNIVLPKAPRRTLVHPAFLVRRRCFLEKDLFSRSDCIGCVDDLTAWSTGNAVTRVCWSDDEHSQPCSGGRVLGGFDESSNPTIETPFFHQVPKTADQLVSCLWATSDRRRIHELSRVLDIRFSHADLPLSWQAAASLRRRTLPVDQQLTLLLRPMNCLAPPLLSQEPGASSSKQKDWTG
jgi:hypothetical protein